MWVVETYDRGAFGLGVERYPDGTLVFNLGKWVLYRFPERLS